MYIRTAFESIHSCGVIHNDIGTGNILVIWDGTVRIEGFDFADIVDESHEMMTGENQIIDNFIESLRRTVVPLLQATIVERIV
jgi:serine/threonine protein kinase